MPDPALDDVANCLCANLRHSTRFITQIYDTALRPCGLTAPQFTILANLKTRSKLSVSQLATVLGMDRTTLTRNLGPLSRDGYIQQTTGQDQRVRQIGLSEHGKRKFDQAYPIWRQAQGKLLAQLGPDAVTDLLAATSGVIAVAQAKSE